MHLESDGLENEVLIFYTTIPVNPLESKFLWDVSAPPHFQIMIIRD